MIPWLEKRPTGVGDIEAALGCTIEVSPFVTRHADDDGTPALDALRADCADPELTLASLPDPTPEEENPAALFKGGWLRKGGGAVLVSTSGTGKSVLTVQAATLWAMGLPAFGIEPVRPLRIAIVQAEDDAEEMAFFRNQIAEGLETEAGMDPASVRQGMGRVPLWDGSGKVGAEFVAWLKAKLDETPVDLVIMNPLQSYFGGDLTRNVELSQFLRVELGPVIQGRCGILIVHHTNKPPAAKDRGGWGTDTFSAYIGAGGAELTNWARATLALMPCEDAPGMFRFVAGKRGGRLGWKDEVGAKSRVRFLAHHDRLVFWRDAPASEAGSEPIGGRGNAKGDAAADAALLAEAATKEPQRATKLREYGAELLGPNRGRRAYDYLTHHRSDFGLTAVQAKWKSAAWIGLKPEAEAAALTWDRTKGADQ